MDTYVQGTNLIQLAAAADAACEARILKARTDFNAFVEFCMEDEKGLPVRQAVHHRVWQLHLRHCWESGKHPAILAPFAHGKSVQLIVGLCAFELGRDPNLRIKIVCQTAGKAKERTIAISTFLQKPRYRQVFPWVKAVDKNTGLTKSKSAKSKWTQAEIYLNRGGMAIDPSVQAAGILTSGTGGRADLLLFDDVVDRRNAIDEPALRQKVIENFNEVWMSRLEPHGRVSYIGTPWHQADLSHELIRRTGWSVLRMSVAPDFGRLDCEVFNPPTNYPLPVAQEQGRSEMLR